MKPKATVTSHILIEDVDVQTAIARIAATPEGVSLFQYLHKALGYEETSIVADGLGKPDPIATLLNDTRRSIYCEIRKLIPRDRLIEIELPIAKPVKPIPRKKVRGLKSDGPRNTGRINGNFDLGDS